MSQMTTAAAAFNAAEQQQQQLPPAELKQLDVWGHFSRLVEH
jgi:hypothetical protein